MARTVPATIDEKQLHSWQWLDDFRQCVRVAARPVGLAPTWTDPARALAYDDYLSLFFFGLLNPVVRTMRGLCAASRLGRVQAVVCRRHVSLGSFSEAQRLLDPALLETVFRDLAGAVAAQAPADARLATLPWMARDGSLWRALPRMHWALYGAGRPKSEGPASKAVRLHLSFHLLDDKPVRAQVRPDRDCERAVWAQDWQPGDAYVGDRYFGENYRLLGEAEARHCHYLIRIKNDAVVTELEELPVSAADRAAGVTRQAWVRLGARAGHQSPRVRLVWVEADGHSLRLVTNLPPAELPAELVSLLYRRRWQIELFFRWIKCLLGCRHWLAESPAGVTLQLYLALIAALLLQLYTGQRPTRRMMELIQFYLSGMATLDELVAGLERARAAVAPRAKKAA